MFVDVYWCEYGCLWFVICERGKGFMILSCTPLYPHESSIESPIKSPSLMGKHSETTMSSGRYRGGWPCLLLPTEGQRAGTQNCGYQSHGGTPIIAGWFNSWTILLKCIKLWSNGWFGGPSTVDDTSKCRWYMRYILIAESRWYIKRYHYLTLSRFPCLQQVWLWLQEPVSFAKLATCDDGVTPKDLGLVQLRPVSYLGCLASCCC